MNYLNRLKSFASKMNKSSVFKNPKIILTSFIFLSLFILVGFTAPANPILFLALLSGLFIALITLVNTDLALIILIFSMLLSPEIPIAQVPERSVVIRIDDILLIFMFFAWLAKLAINKELGLLKRTPINRPLGIYVLCCIVITAGAIFLRIGQAKLSNAIFYIFKYIEYFVLFFLVANNLKSVRQSKKFLLFLLLTCLIVSIYGYVQIKTGVLRVGTPFEGEKTEPNTLAGYFIIIFGLIAGLILHSRHPRIKFFLASLFLFMIPVFLFTLSRGGYVGFVMMYLALIIFTKKKRMFLTALLLVLIVILPFILPVEVVTRVRTTFTGTERYDILGKRVALAKSAAARIELWKYIWDIFPKSPLFGYGVTGISFLDSQYARIIGELGIIGLTVFFWLIYALFKNVLRIYRESRDDYTQGLSLGFLAGFIGLLAMGLTANVFIIVRIMEPFWFITAMVLMTPQIQEETPQAEI